MIGVEALTPGREADWDGFVASRPEAHFAQRIAWRRLNDEFFGVSARWWLARREGGEIRGVLPAFRQTRALYSAPGGILAADEEAAGALIAAARHEVDRNGLLWLELRDQAAAWTGLETNDEHVTLVLDLPSDDAALWDGFDAKLRNQVRKAEKSGVTCARGAEHLGAFHRVFVENMRDLGTPAMEEQYFRRVLELYGDDAEVIVVRRGDLVLGGMLVVRQGGTLYDPWASSLRRHFALCPNTLLYREALRLAVEWRCRRFDFGRSQPASGTYRFKEQFGARPLPLYYQYALGRAKEVPTLAGQKASLDLAVRMWKRLPLPLARLVGPRARRFFPEAL